MTDELMQNPVDETPVEKAPVEEAPVEETPIEEAPAMEEVKPEEPQEEAEDKPEPEPEPEPEEEKKDPPSGGSGFPTSGEGPGYDYEEYLAKLKEKFGPMIVCKGQGSQFFASLSIPGYIRDWFLMRYANADGTLNGDFALAKIRGILPGPKEFLTLRDKIMNEGEKVKFLARIRIQIDVMKGEAHFSLPDFDVPFQQTTIDTGTWNRLKDKILSDDEIWGVVTLDYVRGEKVNKIRLVDFVSFRPYSTDLAYYRQSSKAFTIDEWIDTLIGAMDYNARNFPTLENKLMMLTRLLPFVQKRVNLIELAPKGTGKSYVFSSISKYGWLVSGGTLSRAKLFYDMSKSQLGLVAHYDYVALDEISTINFGNVSEMQGALKGYLEQGAFAVGTKKASSDAGMVFLGNIPSTSFNLDSDLTATLPAIFKDSALVDRIHGIVEGWKIPRMDEKLKASGWALNCEYFSEIMHSLREDPHYDSVVNSYLDATSGDTRDISAVKRLAAAYLKLLFPYVDTCNDLPKEIFDKYCLQPAIHLRSIVKGQLGRMDKEFAAMGMAKITLK